MRLYTVLMYESLILQSVSIYLRCNLNIEGDANKFQGFDATRTLPEVAH